MSRRTSSPRAFAKALTLAAVLAFATAAGAFEMMSNPTIGPVYTYTPVQCDAVGGFIHWETSFIPWYWGTTADRNTALLAALAAWNDVPNATHSLSKEGVPGPPLPWYATDGKNTISWPGSTPLCTGDCLAVTVVHLGSGQKINEADIYFNNQHTWNTNGSDFDVQSVATHELGHTLGIGHSSVSSATMREEYFGTGMRSLASDDMQALQCSEDWYLNPNYQGQHTVTNCRQIAGWAWNQKRPNGFATVDIRNGYTIFSTQVADDPGAPVGNGNHAFSIVPPSSLKDGTTKTIRITHQRSGILLDDTTDPLICKVTGFVNQSPASFNDTLGTSWSVGNVFRSDISGYVTHLRYYRAAQETGTHTLTLWEESSEDELDSVTFDFGSDLTAGWEEKKLAGNGVWIDAGVNYVVSVTTSVKQTKTDCGFSTPVVNGPLTTHGGRWVQGVDVFPTTSSCSNFWTDVRFDQ